ncbi:MAG: ACT domain-containing protein [Armatimonadetes bacterium]|nr:ACT domain-containing protein [Armatimonadota bacterium]
MARKMALSAVGSDCPGIVCEVSRVLYEHGCNLEDSSMTILRGEFAMILIVAVPEPADLGRLNADLHAVADRLHLILSFRELPLDEPPPAREAGSPYMVSVYGADKPGIVYRVTDLLARRSINITDVNTRVVGEQLPVYIMLLEVDVPESIPEREIEEILGKLARELSVDITVRPLETAQL